MTQLQAAKSGMITREMEQVAAEEKKDPAWICDEVAAGRIVIPKNINHEFDAKGIGQGLKTKINANIGTSEAHCNLAEEIRKLEIAIKYGADSVMDLSTGGKLDFIRRTMLKKSTVMVGTVPIYAVASELMAQGMDVLDMTADMLFAEIEKQGKDGVDFITVHCGITRRSLPFLENDARTLGVVSRGGSLIRRWIKHHDRENPLYEQYDRLMDICETYDITLSLGDGLRPGCQDDATDRGQVAELLVLGELVDRAVNRGIQVMVEGPGHVPLNDIAVNIMLQKKVCNNAPFYVLGPLTTDIAPGYDHIVGAIGAAIAGAHGADFLCYVTPAEHLCLPTEDDVRQGVVASRIAAHSADIVKGVAGALERDLLISKARRNFDWESIYRHAIDPELARHRKESSEKKGQDECTMCGNLCAVKTDRMTK